MVSLLLSVEEKRMPHSSDIFEKLVEKNGFYLATTLMFLKYFLKQLYGGTLKLKNQFLVNALPIMHKHRWRGGVH